MHDRTARVLWLLWITLLAALISASAFGLFLSKQFNPKGYEMVFKVDRKSPGDWTVHKVFMVVGCGGLMTFAINAHRVLPFKREANRLIHALLHSLAVGAAGVAFIFIFFLNQNNPAGPRHFTDVHGQLGIVLVPGFFLIYISALCIVYFIPISPRLRIQLIPLHRFFGFAFYIAAMAQILMALWHEQEKNADVVKEISVQLGLAAFIVLGVWSSLYNIYHRNAALGVTSSESLVDPLRI